MQHMKVHRHWARRVEGSMVTLVSIICSLASAHAVWWFFSGLNWIDSLQWLVTILLAAGFVGLGFVISRALAHRILHKQKVGMVLFIALLYELVEVGCCFTQASIGIQHITWLSSLHGGLHAVVCLCPLRRAFRVRVFHVLHRRILHRMRRAIRQRNPLPIQRQVHR